ncbi:MAG: hypothetical protein ACTHKB_00780 [Burkholderiaceae bacterium]
MNAIRKSLLRLRIVQLQNTVDDLQEDRSIALVEILRRERIIASMQRELARLDGIPARPACHVDDAVAQTCKRSVK